VLNVTVNKIEIGDIRNNTFYANIYLIREGESFTVDARPSDAIALALRAHAPIFVEENVIEKSRNVDFGIKITDLDKLKEDKIREYLENLSAEDFGKYKM
jgi:bifunctional DNase/RNase